MHYEVVNFGDKFKQFPDILDKDLYLEGHGGFVVFFLVVPAVLVLAVDAIADQLQKPGDIAEGHLLNFDQFLVAPSEDLRWDQIVGDPLEILEVLEVGLFGGVENLVQKYNCSIEVVLILHVQEYLLYYLLKNLFL